MPCRLFHVKTIYKCCKIILIVARQIYLLQNNSARFKLILILLFTSFYMKKTLNIIWRFKSIRREFRFGYNFYYRKTILFVDEWISLSHYSPFKSRFCLNKTPSIPLFVDSGIKCAGFWSQKLDGFVTHSTTLKTQRCLSIKL